VKNEFILPTCNRAPTKLYHTHTHRLSFALLYIGLQFIKFVTRGVHCLSSENELNIVRRPGSARIRLRMYSAPRSLSCNW